MGRGGGGGGSHRSGGGSFHYSGGGRSGRSSSSHRSSTSSSHSYHTPRPPRHYGGSYYGGTRTNVFINGAGRAYNAYWKIRMWASILTTVLVCVFLIGMLLFAALSTGSAPKSTHERTKLASSECRLIDDWFRDDVEWIHNKSRVVRGLRDFYNQTGVQPYLWITDNINGNPRPTESDFENALNDLYNSLFSDEGHMVVCFMESSPDVWATYYVAGDSARNVIDEEAGDILHSYFSRYYTSDMEDEDYMATVFEKTAKAIMTVSKSNKAVIWTVCGVIAALGLVVVILVVVFAIAKKKKEQAEIDRDILQTPLQDIHDPLEDKYDV